MIQENEISRFTCSQSTHAWSVKSRKRRISEWARPHHVLVKIKNHSMNVQVSCSRLELCGKHVVMLQVNALQIAHIQQLGDIVLEWLTVWTFAQNRDFFWSRTRNSWQTHPVPMWRMDLSKLEILFLLRNGVGTLRIEADSRFTVTDLDAGCTTRLSSSSSETAIRDERRDETHYLSRSEKCSSTTCPKLLDKPQISSVHSEK